MKVNYNAIEKMDLEGVYLRKICQCSSDLTITNGDVLKPSTDERGMVTIACLCCDTELKLRRVFSKKCYTMEQLITLQLSLNILKINYKIQIQKLESRRQSCRSGCQSENLFIPWDKKMIERAFKLFFCCLALDSEAKTMKKYLSFLLSAVILVSSMQLSNIPVHAEENETWTFEYTGSVEEWTAPYTGQYHLSVSGAAGGAPDEFKNTNYRGLGGNSYGEINLLKGQKLYISVGEAGRINGPRTYGGGGAGGNGTGSGGGASFISFVNRGQLTAFENHKEDLVLVAGGAGGSSNMTNAQPAIASGGGFNGIGSACLGLPYEHRANGGTQESGYAFGQGQDYNQTPGPSISNCGGVGGLSGAGGGGLYGGYHGVCGATSGAGGSGFINKDKVYDYNTNSGVKNDNGDVKIEYIGEVYTDFTIDLNGHGNYDGNTDKAVIHKKYGEEYEIKIPKQTDEYTFLGWEVMFGEVKDFSKYTFTFEPAYIRALWKAPLTISGEVNKERQGIDIFFSQKDILDKKYVVYQSKDKENWYPVIQNSDAEGKNEIKQEFDYIGHPEEYHAPVDGLYKLEVMGSTSYYSRSNSLVQKGGGYSVGYKNILKDSNLIIVCGGADGNRSDISTKSQPGYNGGGRGGRGFLYYGVAYTNAASGGGATHIATTLRGDGQLKNYNSYRDEVLLCAGGAGGARHYPGVGGGLSGGWGTNCNGVAWWAPGTQTSGYAFGQGQDGFDRLSSIDWTGDTDASPGGGGGWYGGCSGMGTREYSDSSAAGGSGHIGDVINGKTISGYWSNLGHAVITVEKEYVSGEKASNIGIPDTEAPNKPSDGKYTSKDDKLELSWQENGDNGNTYYHKAESYLSDDENGIGEKLNDSNIIESYIETGVAGFYYFINDKEVGTVTKEHTFVESDSIEVPTAAYDRYLHVAAVDGAGNISDTYTIKIPSVAKYVVNHYAQNEDGSYVLVETEELMGTIGTTVIPEVHPQTGRDNPETQSVVITADGKAHVDYYYDVTRFDINGSVSWNDHENLYGTRPDDTGITIYRDGEYFDYITILTTDTVNKYQFPALQKYDLETGLDFEYIVSQDVAYSQAALESSEDKYQTKQNGFDFLNTIRNVEPVSPDEPNPDNPDDKGLYVEGDIYWDDNNDSLGFRPSETTITLYQKGEDGEWKVFGDPIVVDAKNDNHYIFDWLPKYWYDENDVPTAYEYKVEEKFEAWYIKDGEIKNAYIIHEDQPNDFDFTNEFIPDGPIIPVNEYTNTIIIKTNTDEQVRIILKPLELFIHNDYSVSYGDPTGNDIPVMTDKTGTSVKDLPGTRYEIVLDSPDYTLEDIKLTLAENIELEEIDDKWYITIKNVPEDVIETLEIELTKKEQFYQDRQRFVNYFAPGIKNITKESQEYSIIKMSDAITISDPEIKDVPDITKLSDSSELTDRLTIIYMNSDTKDLNVYSIGDKVEILDYLGEIPDECKFIGWSETINSEKTEYMVKDIIEIKENLTLYPVFKTIQHQLLP